MFLLASALLAEEFLLALAVLLLAAVALVAEEEAGAASPSGIAEAVEVGFAESALEVPVEVALAPAVLAAEVVSWAAILETLSAVVIAPLAVEVALPATEADVEAAVISKQPVGRTADTVDCPAAAKYASMFGRTLTHRFWLIALTWA